MCINVPFCLRQLPGNTDKVVISANGTGLGIVQVSISYALSLSISLARLSSGLSKSQSQ